MEQHQKTLVDLSQTIAGYPNDAYSLAHRGEIYHLMSCYKEALADFDRAIALKPDYIWAIAHRGETYRLIGCYEKALADFDQAIELKSDYGWAMAHRGVMYRVMGRNEEALADFNRAIELMPDNVWSLVHRGLTCIVVKRYEAALADFDQAFALDKLDMSYWPGERGLVLNFLGRYTEAIACCEAVLQKNPADHMALYSLVVAKACWQGLDVTQAEIKEARAVLEAMLQVAENGKARASVLYRLGGLAALQGEADQALNYLKETIPLDDEPIEQALHDPAWRDLHADPRFQVLVTKTRTI